jgi:hypothetical protein
MVESPDPKEDGLLLENERVAGQQGLAVCESNQDPSVCLSIPGYPLACGVTMTIKGRP